MATKDDWALTKIGPPEDKALEYPNHKRACEVYSQWMSGFTEDEIAEFFGVELMEIKHDLQHMQTALPVRTIIQHNNDRARIIIQRQESENFRAMLSAAIRTPVERYLGVGQSPAGVMREYREAVGLTQRPEPLSTVNIQQNFGGQEQGQQAKTKIITPEDIIRKVLDGLAEQESAEVPVIEAEIEPEVESDEEEAQG